jgi:hypothetical protein
MNPSGLVSAFLLTLALAACAHAPSRDEQLAKDLLGKWSEVRKVGCNCDREEQSIDLKADRTFQVVGVRRDPSGSQNYSFSGEWKVEDGHFWSRVTSAQPAELHAPGEERRDEIKEVTEWEWVTIERTTGAEARAWRFPK